MMKRYKLLRDGSILYEVSKKTARSMWNNNSRECLDLCWIDSSEKSIYEFTDLDEIEDKDCVYLYVGCMTRMVDERKKLFSSLRDIQDYFDDSGQIPWGMRSIASSNHWENIRERGYTFSYSDGKDVLRYQSETRTLTITPINDENY